MNKLTLNKDGLYLDGNKLKALSRYELDYNAEDNLTVAKIELLVELT